MPTQLPPDRSGTAQPAPGIGRRSVLRGAAGLGAAGLAVAAGAGAVVAATRPANTAASPPRTAAGIAAGTAASTATRASGAEPLVVYLRDAAAGEFEVFHGTQQVKVRNPKLVAQLLDGIATAQ
jgi:hypothetical protein